MRYVAYIFLLQYALFSNQFDFLNAEPLYGNNIRVAEENEFPFVVSIGNKVNDAPVENHFCTGALITQRHVLTAEHCLEGETIDGLQVTVGTVDVRGGTKYGVRSAVTFNEWAEQNGQPLEFEDNDIAILTLSEDVNDPNAKIATLSPTELRKVRGTNATVAGWGVSNSGTIPRYMETVNFRVLSITDCMEHVKQVMKKRVIVPTKYLCSSASPYALIQDGDSGGPIFNENHEIIGVNESTLPRDIKNSPDVMNLHLSVDYYRNFINDVIQNT